MAATDYDWQSSRNDLIQRAFRIIGALPLGQPLSAELMDQGVRALNDMVKSWQNKNTFLWTKSAQTFSLAPSAVSVSIPSTAPIVGLDSAKLYDGVNELYELEIGSFRQYESIPNVAQSGDPTFCAYSHTFNSIALWPVPTRALTLIVWTILRAKDWDDSTSTGDFTARWTNALVYGLARELSFEHTMELGELDRLAKRAEDEFALAKRTDRDSGQYEFVRSAFCGR